MYTCMHTATQKELSTKYNYVLIILVIVCECLVCVHTMCICEYRPIFVMVDRRSEDNFLSFHHGFWVWTQFDRLILQVILPSEPSRQPKSKSNVCVHLSFVNMETCRSQFSPLAMWFPRIEFRLSDLATSSFIYY